MVALSGQKYVYQTFENRRKPHTIWLEVLHKGMEIDTFVLEMAHRYNEYGLPGVRTHSGNTHGSLLIP